MESSATIAALGATGNGPNGPTTVRLMITKMVLENFKSYAGVQEIGPFHKRFSSIVGPNGSGKSNVIDALLFVFGKRAKQLRLNKVSELIHKSSGYPNLEYAKVMVYFQLIKDFEASDDDFEVIPGSEFVVTRTAFTNNQSKYNIDAKNSTYTEVGQLLRQYGIDLDNNRFLILQGEVEQIAMMKPKAAAPGEEGLLEYLEDIIGSNRYVEAIDEYSKKLDGLNEQRIEKVNRLKLAEKERDNLSDSKQDAETFIEKEKEIRRKKNILYQIYEYIAKNNVADLTERKQVAVEKLNYERNKYQTTEANSRDISKTYESALASYNAIEADLQRTTAEFTSFEKRDVKLQEDMKHCKAQLKKLQAAIDKDSKKEEELLTKANTATTQIDQAKKSLNEIAASKAEEEAKLDEIMQGLQESTKGLRENLENAQVKLADAERGIASLQTEKETVLTSIQLLQSRAETAMKNISLTEEKLQKILIERESIQGKINGADKERASLEQRIKKLEREIDVKVEEENNLQNNLRNAVTAAEEAKATVTLQQSSGRNGAVASLLKASKKGGPLAGVGIRGRLGDLATISPQYDVAISTACGQLDNIVVNTPADGEACINYLRETNGGRVTCIVLSALNQWKSMMDKPVSPPESTPRLFDLIRPVDDEFQPAFYLALKDTLVCNDLDTATRVAFERLADGSERRWRVVTLDGNLVENSGAMSGGGKEVKSGSMMLSKGAVAPKVIVGAPEITPAQLQQLEAKVVELQNQLDTVRSAKIEMEQELKDCKSKIRSMPTDIEKMKMVLVRLAEQEGELNQRLITLRSETELSSSEKNELAKLTSCMQGLDAEIQKVSPNLTPLRTEVSMLQRQILDFGGPKLSRIQSKVDALSAQYDALSSQLATREVEENDCRKQAAKCTSSRVKSEEDIAKINEKHAALLEEQKIMEQEALVVIQAVDEAKEKMSVEEEKLKSMTKEYEEIKANLQRIKRVEIDLNEEIEHISTDLKKENDKVNSWRKDLDSLRKLHIDEQNELNSTINDALSVLKPSGVTDGAAPVMEFKPEIESLPVLSNDMLGVATSDMDEIKKEINLLENSREKMKKDVNMSALLEYLKKDAQYKARLYDLEAITEVRNEARKGYEELRRKRLEEFMSGFGIITLKLKEMYQMITLGGDAELELVDSLDPFSEGIVFSVRPPKKSWKNISNLSGGEKTLSSLALVFALHHFKPTPLYVMDEIDAALDFKNVSIVANYIKERTKNAQFVIISLRNNMFELADRLVGIYKTHDTTKSVTINPKLFTNSVAGVKMPSDNTVVSNDRPVLGDATNRK